MICRDELCKIYKQAFGSSEPFDTLLFEAFGDCIESLKDVNGRELSMLFKIPCTLHIGSISKKIYYIYAAATAVDCRGRGYMKKLILRVLKTSDAPLFLKPATRDLVKFYRSLGFSCIAAGSDGQAEITVNQKQKQLSKYCESCKNDYILMFSKPPCGVNKIKFSEIME